MRKILPFLLLPSLLLASKIFTITIDSPIHSVTQEYLSRALKQAVSQGGELFVIKLNTPGGLDTAMRKMMKEMLNASIPVVVFVYPSGARAASAGFFLALAADFVAMAPGTNIGAAHPVAMGEKMDKVMSEKVAQDASALARSLAQARGRSVKLAEAAVKESRSFSEKEALEGHLADAICKNMHELIETLKGKTLKKLDGREFHLELSEPEIIEIPMTFAEKFLKIIANPSFAYFLLMIGLLGLYFEFSHPGAIFPGVIGGICLILAFFAFQILPINIAGLLLILLGIGLFIAEAKVQSYGILGIGGIISMFIGSLMLIKSPDPSMKPALSLIIAVVAGVGAIALLLIYLIAKTLPRKPLTGAEGMIGERGIARTPIKPKGKVFVHGELWDAISDEEIEEGEEVVVIGYEGMILKVKKGG